MSESDISAILNAITDMRTEVRGRFETVFVKIDGVCNRVNILESDKIARDAVAVVEEKQEEKKRDWGKWAVRVTLIIIATWALTQMLSKYFGK